MNDKQPKTCFVVSPMGEEGSDTRERADKVFTYIIQPAVEEWGYHAERADHIDNPGRITPQVVDKLVNADLVIADLTGSNPNVFYELAIRHAVKKPIIQIIQADETVPFDVFDVRTVPIDTDVEAARKAVEAISALVLGIHGGAVAETPLSRLGNIEALKGSSKPIEQVIGDLTVEVQEIRAEIRYFPQILAKLVESLGKVPSFLRRPSVVANEDGIPLDKNLPVTVKDPQTPEGQRILRWIQSIGQLTRTSQETVPSESQEPDGGD